MPLPCFDAASCLWEESVPVAWPGGVWRGEVLGFGMGVWPEKRWAQRFRRGRTTAGRLRSLDRGYISVGDSEGATIQGVMASRHQRALFVGPTRPALARKRKWQGYPCPCQGRLLNAKGQGCPFHSGHPDSTNVISTVPKARAGSPRPGPRRSEGLPEQSDRIAPDPSKKKHRIVGGGSGDVRGAGPTMSYPTGESMGGVPHVERASCSYTGTMGFQPVARGACVSKPWLRSDLEGRSTSVRAGSSFYLGGRSKPVDSGTPQPPTPRMNLVPRPVLAGRERKILAAWDRPLS